MIILGNFFELLTLVICQSIKIETIFSDKFRSDLLWLGNFGPKQKAPKIVGIILDGFLRSTFFDFEIFQKVGQ